MRVYEKVVYEWTEERKQYVEVYSRFYDYSGPVALTCGASQEQKDTEQAQSDFMKQTMQQSQEVFGATNSVFQGLMKTFAPIVAAGPSQKGFSPQEESNLNSQAITQTGQAYKNAAAAVGNAQAAQGGGTMALPSGAQVGQNLQLASSAANQTSSELSQITENNYATGRQNYEQAVQGELAAPGVFNTSTGASNAGTSSGEATANTANQIAQQNNSWMSAVSGALGTIGGAAIGGFTKNLGGKQGSTGNV